MARTKKVTCYIVQEVSWAYNDEYYYREDGEQLTGESFHQPVKVFRTQDKAEAFAKEKDRARQQTNNPFSFCEGLEEMTTLSVDEFWTRVEALGVKRPKVAKNSYWFSYDWWETSKFKPAIADAIWDLFDRIRFFEVVETEIPLEA